MINITSFNQKGTYKQPNIFGYYGDFGGAYIPEMLHRNVEELKSRYLEIMYDTCLSAGVQCVAERLCRPTNTIVFAERLSHKYNTNVYLKSEDLNHTGAHKINNAIGQVLLAQRLGKKRIIAETGAGQHGVATATVCALKGIECVVYMGEVDIERQAPNVARMKMLGATVIPATSGSKTLKDATNEAIRALDKRSARYALCNWQRGRTASLSRYGGAFSKHHQRGNTLAVKGAHRQRIAYACGCLRGRWQQCCGCLLSFS